MYHTLSGKNTQSHLPVSFVTFTVHSKNACALVKPKLGNIRTISNKRSKVFDITARFRLLLVQCLTSDSLLDTNTGIKAATLTNNTVGRKYETIGLRFIIFPVIGNLFNAVTIT